MRKLIPAAVAVAAIVTALAAVPARAGTAVNWRQRTCSAVQAYASHPTRARLDAMVTDSLHVAWSRPGSKYGLGSDVYGLGGDVLGGKTRYVARDLAFVLRDCSQ